MTTTSKNVYIDKLDNIVNKYKNANHRRIKMKPGDVKSNAYIDSSKEINNKDPKFKIDGVARISKYKNIFEKDYVPNWSEEVYLIKRVKNTCPWTYFISDPKGEEIFETFYEKQLQKQIKKSLELKK